MHYYYYKQCRDAAWELLRDYSISEMPVSMLRLCRELGITVAYHDLNEDELGRCTIIKNKPYILLDRNMSNAMKRFVCAHELGHLLLEHFEYGTEFSYTINDRKKGLESGAELFAMRLLSPACVLWGCAVSESQDIAKICGIEREYADKRMRRMKALYKRDKFLSSPLEREVYEQFLPFIDKYVNDRQ